MSDFVLRFNQSWGRGKDEDVYSGPYVVKRLLGNTSLVFGDLIDLMKTRVFSLLI